MEAKFALFRITVLGGPGCGKTSLINVFVNNFCPTVPVPTDDPCLYYKTINLPHKAKEGTKDGAQDNVFPALVEIEDTYASTRESGTDCYGAPRDIKSFLNVIADDGRVQADVDSGGLPLSCAPMPKVSKYEPITSIRMAFMIVFDASDDNSLTEAIDVFEKLQVQIQLKKAHLNPIIYLVANKLDKSDKGNKVVALAEEFAESRTPKQKVERVSALEIRKVKQLFRKVLSDVRDNHVLWNDTSQDEAEGKVEDQRPGTWQSMGGATMNKENCTVQ